LTGIGGGEGERKVIKRGVLTQQGQWEQGEGQSRGSNTSIAQREAIGGDTRTIGDNSRPGLPGSTEILGRDSSCMGTASNRTTEIRKIGISKKIQDNNTRITHQDQSRTRMDWK